MATESVNREGPSWLAGVAASPSVAEQPLMQATQPMKEYAAWYSWARAHEADQRRCHLAAQAALAALQQGRDGTAAAQEAQAHAYGAPPDAPVAADARTRLYAGWYAIGIHQLHLAPEPASRFAYAALVGQESGLDQKAAARAGLASIGQKPAAATATWWYDPAIRSAALGGLSLFAVLFLPFYFVVLPVFGLVSGLRAMASPRVPLAMAGLVLNGIALLVTAASFAGLHLR